MILIVDYGVGNLRSIQNMLARAGHESAISGEPAAIREATKLILPGVGHFRYGMESLQSRGLAEALTGQVVERRVPILGICLGAQLLGRRSDEGGAAGLGWVPMDVVAFDRLRLGPSDKVPHMGWTDTEVTPGGLFEGLEPHARFYYVHSYHFRCDDPETVISTAWHGYAIASGIRHRNIFGVQFHPEKSHRFGQQVLRNFAQMKGGEGLAPRSEQPQPEAAQ
jgi:glutamine amidotransferase